ncbi:MAG: DNA-processing protein DprA [bacterium]|nr:DNA-processing protein DprA [bacterium]
MSEIIQTIHKKDAAYPSLLKETAEPPEKLFVRGQIPEGLPALAVVGSRKPTRYGMEATEKLIRELAASAELIIVSGLAVGIDTIAHKTALSCGLKTIGVLGSGLDRASFFPQENWGLSEKIIEAGGAVISEYPEGTPGLPHHFPARNRIIAGLSQGTLVIEAKEKSGALITARLALEENREVFAVPGSIFSIYSEGPNLLIQRGAKLVRNAKDIADELNIPMKKTDAAEQLEGDEKILWELLSEETSVDDLVAKTGLHAKDVLTLLSMLELKQFTKKIGGDAWIRA